MGFGRDMQEWTRRVSGHSKNTVAMANQEISNRILRRTPVDTGNARSHWQPSGNLEGPIYKYTNNVEYILALEFGHSKQAPNGMVRRSAEEWPEIVEQAAKDADNVP